MFWGPSGGWLHSCFLPCVAISLPASDYVFRYKKKKIKTVPNTVMWLFFHFCSLTDPPTFLSDHVGLTIPQRCPQSAKSEKPSASNKAILPYCLHNKCPSIGRLWSFGLAVSLLTKCICTSTFQSKAPKMVKGHDKNREVCNCSFATNTSALNLNIFCCTNLIVKKRENPRYSWTFLLRREKGGCLKYAEPRPVQQTWDAAEVTWLVRFLDGCPVTPSVGGLNPVLCWQPQGMWGVGSTSIFNLHLGCI